MFGKKIDYKGCFTYLLLKLIQDKIHIDSVHHNNNMIMKSLYANEINKLIVLD